MRRRITARGLQPVLSAAYRFQSLILWGGGTDDGAELLSGVARAQQLALSTLPGAVGRHRAGPLHLLVLDNGAFHKAHALRLPPNVGLLFLPPYAPELNPIERLWRDLKDWLAPRQPPTLDELSALLTTRLRHYTPARLRSLTGFPYFVAAARHVI